MDEKLTIENIAAILAAKLNIEQTDADAFVCSFLSLIEEGLKRDKYVKVKGLGTFKLIVPPGNGSKVVFIPDASLRDNVNKPFSHFGPVELNDGVSFSDIDEISSSEGSDSTSHTDSEPDLIEEEQTVSVAIEEKPLSVFDNETEGKERKWLVSWYMLAAVLFVGVIIGGGIMWGVFSDRNVGPVDENVPLLAEEEPLPVATGDTAVVSEDTIEVTDKKADDTLTVHKKVIDSIITAATDDTDEIEYLSDEVVYKISGTLDTFTIKNGSTLSKVAYKYFRNKKLWPYIVMYNKDNIKDPNNVPIGTVLRIPKLVPAQ